MTVVIRSQAEWNALPSKYDEYTTIEIRSDATTWITINKVPESAHVEARGSAHVVAWGSAHVVARESAHVVAWESAHVVAWGSCAVHVQSDLVEAVLFGFAVCIALAKKAKITKRSTTATVVEPEAASGLAGWLGRHGLDGDLQTVTVYKRVSHDFKTQEKTENETLWLVGTTVKHPKWEPTKKEVGPGKFHACPRPFFCDEFRSGPTDRYVAIEVERADLYVWDDNPAYPHKIAFREGRVMAEVDHFGKDVETLPAATRRAA